MKPSSQVIDDLIDEQISLFFLGMSALMLLGFSISLCLLAREYMTAEVSGLPESGADRPRLEAARTPFEGFFVARPIGTNYRRFNPPIQVMVSGSLFFDVDHPADAVGPVGLKPATAWEIHPVTAISFESE